MARKQTIAIVGATGPIGSEIAKSLSKANYRLLLNGGDADELTILSDVLKQSGGRAEVETTDSTEALRQADIIMIGTPGDGVQKIADHLGAVASGKIIVSTSGEFNTAQTDLPIDSSTAEELQKMLPNASVVKTFSIHLGSGFGSSLINSETRDTFIAGNDHEAVKTVTEVIRAAGYQPIVAGNLIVSRKLEKMQAMFHQLTTSKDFNWYARWKVLHG